MSNNGYDKTWDVLRSKCKVLKQRYVFKKRELSRNGARGKIKANSTLMRWVLGQRTLVVSLASNINSSGKIFVVLIYVKH